MKFLPSKLFGFKAAAKPLTENYLTLGFWIVRYLGIFIINLIQKYNISRFVTAYMCMCISLMNTTACSDNIQMNTVAASTVITEIREYPAEGPMPRASEAPFALVDIVRFSKSWTTVDAGGCSQCSPMNGSPGRRCLDVPGRRRDPRAISSRKNMDEQSWIAPQKPNRRTPRARFSGGARVPETPALPLLRARRGTGRGRQRAAEMWILSGTVAEDGV